MNADRNSTEHERRGSAKVVRTCAGCRTRDSRSALLRFAIRDEAPRLVPDVGGRLGGRGVSVHPRRACLELAVRRGGLARAIRGTVEQTPGELSALAADQYRRRVTGLLLAAGRRRWLAIGNDAVEDSLARRTARLLVVARDAATRRDALRAQAERLGTDRCVLLSTKEELGRWLGRAEVAVISILDDGIAAEVAHAATCVNQLSEEE